MALDCLFCKIVDGRIKGDVVHRDEHTVAFRDIAPQAPVHILVVPTEHIPTLNDTTDDHTELLGRLMRAAATVAREQGLTDYRLNVNTNRSAGQSVFHIHVHVLGGRQFGWPPG